MLFIRRDFTDPARTVGGPPPLLERCASKWRQSGPLYLLLRLLHRITPEFLFTASQLIVTVNDIRAAPASGDADPEVRWATPSDIDLIAATTPRGALLRRRFGRDCKVAVLIRDDNVIALEWFVTAPPGGTESWLFSLTEGGGWIGFRLPPQDIWSVESWVAPAHRGKRLIVRCQSFANRHFAARNFARSWGVTYIGNERAMRAHTRRGHRPVGRIYYVRFLGLTFLCADDAAKLGCWTGRRPIELSTDVFTTQDQFAAKQ